MCGCQDLLCVQRAALRAAACGGRPRAGNDLTGTGNRPHPAVTARIHPRRILHRNLRTVNLPPVTRSLVGKRLTLLT
jgi:hypothetical protein